MVRSRSAALVAAVLLTVSGCGGADDPAPKTSPTPAGPAAADTVPTGTFTSHRTITAAPKGAEDAIGEEDESTWTLTSDCAKGATTCAGTVKSSGGAKLTFTWDGEELVFVQEAYDEQVPTCVDENGKEVEGSELGLHRTYELGAVTVTRDEKKKVKGWTYDAVEKTTPVDETKPECGELEFFTFEYGYSVEGRAG